MGKVRRPRTLRDINVIGAVHAIPDPLADGGKQVVWLQKLNPADQTLALRKANAARARARAAYEDKTSDEWMELQDDYRSLLDDVDRLIDIVISDERIKLNQSVESELELGEEDGEPTKWGKDGYLQGLRDAWVETGRDRYIEDEDDPEARRILDEFQRFGEEVAAIVDPQIEEMKVQYRAIPLDTLRERALEQFVKLATEKAWVSEFERAELYLAVRKPCDECKAEEMHSFVHDDLYFQGRDAVDSLDESVLKSLLEAYHDLVTEVTEGKDSPGSPASSSSSESPEPEETAEGSGLVDAAV